MNLFIIYAVIVGIIGTLFAIRESLELRNRFGYITISEILFCLFSLLTAWFWLPLILFAEIADYIENFYKKIKNIRLFEVKKSTYDPEATCYVTPALKQSQCGTTCCTPNEG